MTTKNGKTTISNIRDLGKAIEAANPEFDIETYLINVMDEDFANMEMATAYRAEAIRLQEDLDGLLPKYEELTKTISKMNTFRFNTERAIAKAKEAAKAKIDASSTMQKLRVWLFDHGKAAEWQTNMDNAVNAAVNTSLGDEIAALNDILKAAPNLLKEAAAMKIRIEELRNAITSENAKADELCKK